MIVKDQLKMDVLERELNALKERHFALQERYEEVITERDALLAESQWHPVSEPPNDNRNVWCHGTIDERGFYQDNRWHYFDDDGQPLTWDNYLPTHWREIPKFREGV